jgi:lipid A 3-O-deacylase
MILIKSCCKFHSYVYTVISRNTILSVILSFSAFFVKGQTIDNTLSFKNINSNSYIRVNYENDVFSGTDIYYTQGMCLEYVAPWMKKSPLGKILVHPRFKDIRYGLNIHHDGYTPSSISSDEILYGDRPFAACLFLQSFLIATDPEKKQRFSSTASIGVIGPAAGGMEMQVGIHKWLHDITPHGWPNQIQNDLVLNYQAGYEKQLFSYSHIFSMDIDAMARAGTLSDKAAIGTTIILGYFDFPYAVGRTHHFRIYAYEHPSVNIIGYDATLQGGLFNKTSPYTIPANDITRATFENRFGFVLIHRNVHLEYFQSMLSSEFRTGNYHVWGGIQVAVSL